MELKIYDGADEIGGSKIYVREGKHGLFLDFGLNFNVNNLYFKEFLSTRPTRGLNDPLEMGLLPRIKAYREDLIPSDVSIENFENIPVDAILLSHAHMDHYGMIGYLNFSIPLVASPETLAIIKAYQDAGRSEIGTSVIYSHIREQKNDGPMPILENRAKSTRNTKDRSKMKEKLKKYLKLRPIIPTDQLSKDEKEFLYLQKFGEGGREYFEEEMKIENLDSLHFNVKAYPVDHSIYGSTGYIVETDSKKIVYTGDLRLHGERGNLTMEFAHKAKGSDVLIIEGTRVSDDREHNFTTEKDVYENCLNAMSQERGLIIADFSARNFERLNSFARMAGEIGRKLVVTDKDAYAISALASVGTRIATENLIIYDKPKERINWTEGILKEEFGWEDRYVGPLEIRKNPELYVLAFSLYDFTNLMDIKPDGGLYLYSSTEAFTEEMELDFYTLGHWLKRYSMRSVGFRIEENRVKFERGYHASGHASGEELRKIIWIVDPDVVVPVHTTNPSWFVREFGDITKILKDGQSMNL